MNKRIVSLLTAIVMTLTIFAVPVTTTSYAAAETGGTGVENSDVSEKMDISDATVEMENAENVYNCTGFEIKPAVTVTIGETVLTQDKDYFVEYRDNTVAGTGYVVINGTGDYEGTTEIPFTIVAKDLSAAELVLDKDNYSYTGKAVIPSVTVTYAGQVLKKDVDYKVTLSDNVYPGTISVTVTGIGVYAGSITKTANLAKVTGVKTSSVKTTSMVVSWNKIKGVSGYEIYVRKANSSKWTLKSTVKDGNAGSCTVTGLTAGKGYAFKVRAYVKKGYSVYAGNFSDVVVGPTKPLKSSIKSLTAKPDLSITVKWNKKTGTGYQIQISTSSSFKNAKTYNVSKTSTVSKKVKSLKKNKKYYVRVRAYTTYGGKTTYGAWSSAKSKKTISTGWMTQSGYKYYYRDGKKVKGSTTINGNPYYFSKSSGKCLGVSSKMWSKVKDASSGTGYLISVSRSANRVCVYTGEKGEWKLKYYWKCSTGMEGYRTPGGSFTIPKTETKLGYIGGHKTYTCWYATRFYKRCFFHSVTYNPASKTSIQDGRLGYNISHGCIRLKLENAKWIYDNIKAGTRVIIY